MVTIIDTLAKIATWVFVASLKTAPVIVFILIIRAILREHLAARWLYVLWLVVMLRLVLPVDVPSPVSLYNLNPGNDKPAALDNTENLAIAANSDIENHTKSKTIISNASSSHQTVVAPSPGINAARRFSSAEILSLIWLFGALVLLTLAARSNLELWRSIRGAGPLKDKRISRILEVSQPKLCITKSMTIYSAAEIKTPMLCGLLRPRIVVPSHVAHTLSDKQVQHILLHELAHYKRGDVLVAWVCTILQALHWFNPLIWLAFYNMRNDREAACDEMVLHRLGAHHAEAYGSTIISLLRFSTQRQLLPVTIGLTDNRSNLTRRILKIRNFSKKSTGWTILAFVVMISVAAVAFTDAPTLKSEPITIKLGKYGDVDINGDAVNPDKVASLLKNEYDLAKATVTVTVQPSAETNAAAIIELSRQLVDAGITEISFVNRDTGKSFPAQFTINDHPMPSSSNSIKYFQQNGKWGYADQDGTVVVPATFDEVYPAFINGLATVKLNNKWGMIDTLGAIVVPMQYDKLGHLEDGRILFQKNNKSGFLDATGAVVIPAQYENAKFFYNNYAPVQQDGLWGFINKDGDMVIQPRFEDIHGFMEGLASVQQNGRWGFVDAEDNLKIACTYEQVNPFMGGLASVRINGKWGFIDKSNNIVIEPQFDGADFFYDSRAVVQIGNKYGVIDQTGAQIIQPDYDMIANYHMGVCFAVIFENKEKGIAAQRVSFDVAGNKLRSEK
ncbi:WG repeat-containing protein [candidate division KSB1 bacterium]|nr:WG repeat-containing protein [candidate division KSB1 bacterium]